MKKYIDALKRFKAGENKRAGIALCMIAVLAAVLALLTATALCRISNFFAVFALTLVIIFFVLCTATSFAREPELFGFILLGPLVLLVILLSPILIIIVFDDQIEERNSQSKK